MRRKRGIILILGPAAGALLAAAVASAGTPVAELDQSQPAVIDHRFSTLALGGAGTAQTLAQTVVAGDTGALAEVRLPVSCTNGILVVEIQGVAPQGVPNGAVRASARVDAARLRSLGTPSFRSVRFDPAPRIERGQRFAIVIRMADPQASSCGVLQGPPGDPYPRGEAYFSTPRNDGWAPLAGEGLDLTFQTFVVRER